MKKIFYVLLVLLFFSCEDQEEYKLYVIQINELNESIEFTEKYDQTFNIIERDLKDVVWNYPKYVKPWYDKALEVDRLSSELIFFIDSLNKKYTGEKDNYEEFHRKVRFKPQDKDALLNKINEFLFKLDTLFVADSQFEETFQKSLIESSKRILNTDSIPISTKRQKAYKTKALLLQLKNLVLRVKIYHFNYVRSRTESGKHWTYFREIIIIPENKKVKKGEKFIAEIFKSDGIDTLLEYPIFVEGKKHEKNKSNYHIFKEKATGNIGPVLREGYMLVVNPATGDSIRYPFKIEYEIIE